MEAERTAPEPPTPIDWESFYSNYRKPGYVPGFEIVNKLGGGVFGMVFKARKESIGKDYAIKFLKVDDEVVRDAVIRELDGVRFFAQIDHPNLVSIEDKGEIDGIPYILMSYAGQETLRKRLEGGGLSRDDALKVFIQAARGVQALHEHSLVHFDLKPANIFLKGDIARVGDYGLSKLVTESRNSLSFGRGTPYYMAPEMLKRRGDVRSDVYSLGVILYECLAGDVPFKGDSEWEVLKKHESEPVSIPDHIGDPERRVIARCLAKDPEDRFQSVSDLLRMLQAPAALGESLVFPRSTAGGGAADADPAETLRSGPHFGRGGGGGGNTARAESFDGSFGPGAAGARSAYVDEGREEDGEGDGDVFGRGPIGSIVHVVFRLFEFGILLVLAPLRLVSASTGRVVVFALQLPFKILSLFIRLLGYAIVVLLLLLVLVGLLSLFASAAPVPGF